MDMVLLTNLQCDFSCEGELLLDHPPPYPCPAITDDLGLRLRSVISTAEDQFPSEHMPTAVHCVITPTQPFTSITGNQCIQQ